MAFDTSGNEMRVLRLLHMVKAEALSRRKLGFRSIHYRAGWETGVYCRV